LGEWDFAKYPEGKLAAPVTQPEQAPVASSLETLKKLSKNTEFDSWAIKHGVDEGVAKSILDTNINGYFLFELVTHDLPPNDELLKFQDGSILTYYRAKSEDVKSLSDEAFNLLLSQDDYNEKTGYFAYNILRNSNKKAELDYVSSLGAMNNRFRLDAQKYGGKLYKMAEPYLNKNPARKTTPVTQPESKPTPVASTSSSDLGDNKAESEAKQQPVKEEAPKQEANSKTPTLDKHNALMDSVRNGKATAEDFKQSFADISANKDAILLELNALTKDQLLKEGGYAVQYRHKNDKKSEVAEAVYHSMIAEYALGRGITYGMGKNSYENAVQKMVESTDQQRLDDFAQEYKQMIDGRISDLKAKAEALENPQTLDDFRMLMGSIMADGKSRQEAFLTLSAEHRIKYDELEAESTKEARETRKRAAQANINTSSQTTDGKIIETKHTRDGYDLFVVQLSDRLSTDDYKKVLSEAKKLGGWYSSYKGGGAIVGFQFKDKEAAQAFLALAGGDTTAAKEQLSQKQDDYADNRSQSAAERLLDMADKIEAKANEELDRDRKANTARRARFAMSAENEARAKIALAKTMRNIAEAIKNGKAKFLDSIRMKTDVEALRAYITTAKDNEIRSEYDSYAEQVKRKGQPPTAATADFATYPTYTLFRSDLAFLGRQLLEIDGLKKLGQQIMAVADDVSDAYLEFAKNNLYKVSRFQTKDSALASFSSKELAERAIKRSGLTGKAIVLQVKRGENLVILSPSEAINLKVWEGDADKRITLKREFGNQLVEAVGRRAGKNNRLLPYQFQYAYDKLKALSRMGIE
ncbi:MAG TPA: hypothetical protein PLQ39_11130, partial [Acinetobacter sp.]|nr:hypothetical protein [Acinetobacter sp.]